MKHVVFYVREEGKLNKCICTHFMCLHEVALERHVQNQEHSRHRRWNGPTWGGVGQVNVLTTETLAINFEWLERLIGTQEMLLSPGK